MERYCINKSRSVADALVRLNRLHAVSMTLFVLDDDGTMLGTVTDGDIRRALIAGVPLSASVAEAMHSDFSYLSDRKDIASLKLLRERQITLIPLLDPKRRLVDIFDLTKRRSALPVDAVLMAGGKGERLRPLTLTLPKPLLPMGEKAIIDHNIDRLAHFGIQNISTTVNYLKELIIEHFKEPMACGVKVDCISEDRFLGTIGSLKLVREFKNDTILVMNSDLLTDIDYEDFYLHFQRHEATMSAAAIPYTIAVPYGIFDVEGREIKGVTEKPTYNLYANAGIYLIKKSALEYIPEGETFNATDLIDALVADGQRVVRYPLSGLWIDIGTPTEYNKAKELIKHLGKIS